jgi:HPr kinase/phosphorylase
MTDAADTSVHATAVLVGNRAVLIRGPSGAGKSRLAFELVLAGRAGQIPPAVLVGDDRVHLQARGGHLVVQPAPHLAGLIEIRGLGIRCCEFADEAIVNLVVDLAATDGARLPEAEALWTQIHGVQIPRIPVAPGFEPLPMVAASIITTKSLDSLRLSPDCVKGIGNHIKASIAPE